MTEQIETTEVQLTRREQLIEATREDGRQLVSIRRIDDLIPIPGADRIQTAMIGGWPIVVKVGEFQVGQLGVYFETDSFLDAEDPRFAFLAEKRVVMKNEDGTEKVSVTKTVTDWNGIEGVRLKSIKLRKQLSQGLLLPLDLFPEIAEDAGKEWLITVPNNQLDVNAQDIETALTLPKYPDEMSDGYKEVRGLNFTTVLKVIKWEKIDRSSGGANLAGRPAGNFPAFLRKSDQTRCQGLGQEIFGYDERRIPFDTTGIPPEAINVLIRDGKVVKTGEGLMRIYPSSASPNELYEVSMKLDGSSMTAYRVMIRDEDGIDVVKYGVCSRNLELKTDDGENEGNVFVDKFKSEILPVLMNCVTYGSFALQGEILAPGIQGNPEGLTQAEFFVYNIFDIDREEFLLPDDRIALLDALNARAEELGLGIKIKHVPILHTNVTLQELGITNMQELLKFADGPSMNAKMREGLVFKAMNDSFQFKSISNEWLIATDN